ncbi:hypothetical protein TeGR_g12161, partial [Tetraparma gracilis]
MPVEWFYADDDGEQSGPVSVQMLHGLFQAGGVNPDTLVWNEGMEGWVELGDVENVFADISASPPTAPALAKVPSVAPPPPPDASPSPPQPPAKSSAPLGYSDEGDDYNDMGLKKTSTTRNATQDAYTPGWAADDQLTSSKVSEDFAKRANISTNVQPAEVTNNLGLRPTGKAVAGSTYGDYKGIGGRNAGGGSFDNTTQDYEGTTSSSLHRLVQDSTGIQRGAVKGARAAAVSVGVETPNSGRSLPSPAAPARARRNSVEVGPAERKQLAPNLFLLKQKTSNPLGFI